MKEIIEHFDALEFDAEEGMVAFDQAPVMATVVTTATTATTSITGIFG
ncbi:hypothetical protein [Nocardiopsis deserti]|nr:hypothetical protein [Nocardiopsis deserti]